MSERAIDCLSWADGFAACALLMSGNYEAYSKLRDKYLAQRDRQPSIDDGLSAVLRNLVFIARTSGGVAGRDEALYDACEKAEALLGGRP